MADVAIMQAAVSSPFAAASPAVAAAIHLSTQIRWNEYLRTTKFFPELDPEGYMKGKNMCARMLHKVELWWKKRQRVLNNPNELDLMLGDARRMPSWSSSRIR